MQLWFVSLWRLAEVLLHRPEPWRYRSGDGKVAGCQPVPFSANAKLSPRAYSSVVSATSFLNTENFPLFFGIIFCFPKRFCGFNSFIYFNPPPRPPPPTVFYPTDLAFFVCLFGFLLAFFANSSEAVYCSAMWSDKYQSCLKVQLKLW